MDPNNQQNSGYGKRPLWQWVWIYVIVGGIIYGLIYYFMMPKSGSSYGIPEPQQNQSYQNTPSIPASTPTAVTSTQNPPPVVVTPPSESTPAVLIAISNYAFSPASIPIRKGTKVTWTNNDNVPHTITGDNGGPSSALLNKGETYSYTFMTAGSFSYHCSVHPTMKGVIRVTD